MLASRLPRESEGDSFHTVTASLPAANTFVVAGQYQVNVKSTHGLPVNAGPGATTANAGTPAEFSWYEYLE